MGTNGRSRIEWSDLDLPVVVWYNSQLRSTHHLRSGYDVYEMVLVAEEEEEEAAVEAELDHRSCPFFPKLTTTSDPSVEPTCIYLVDASTLNMVIIGVDLSI